jgi:hypothetical protein
MALMCVLLSALAIDYDPSVMTSVAPASTNQSAATHKDTILPAEINPVNPEWVLTNNVNTTGMSE